MQDALALLASDDVLVPETVASGPPKSPVSSRSSLSQIRTPGGQPFDKDMQYALQAFDEGSLLGFDPIPETLASGAPESPVSSRISSLSQPPRSQTVR